MIRALLLVLAAALLPQQAPARDAATQAQTGTASISGVVIAAADKQPIGFARVALNSTDRITYANAKGEFLFPKLPAGLYAISVQASGYLPMSLGQSTSGRPGIAQVLAAGEERKSVMLVMHKGGVVSGHVVGPDGRPLSEINVGVLRKSWAHDGSIAFVWSAQGKTDDRGDYRIPGLIAGSYLVEVVPPGTLGIESASAILEAQRLATEGMIQTFYPGTTDAASALPITVEVDAERAGIDFAIQPTPMVRVSGRVDGFVVGPVSARPQGQVNAGTLRLQPSAQTSGGILANNTGRGPFARVAPDGRFRFEAVPVGEYQLLYSWSDAGRAGSYGASSITLSDRDSEDVTVGAHPAANVVGDIVITNAPGKPASVSLFGLIPLSGFWRENSNFIPARMDPSGTFAINGLAPGRYAFSAAAPAEGKYLAAIDVDGARATGTLLEIGFGDMKNVRLTFATDVAEISGNIRRENLQPVAEYALVVFPSDKREWPVWMTGAGVSRADSSGRYKYSTRPGSYLIAAVDDVEQNQWLDPAFLESLIPTATKITLGPGQKLTQDFVVK